MSNLADILNKHYDALFDELTEEIGDGLGDLSIAITIPETGLVIHRSWADRNQMLEERNDKKDYLN